MMTSTKKNVTTVSATIPAHKPYRPGECRPYPFAAKPDSTTEKPGFPLAMVASTPHAAIAPTICDAQ